MLNFDLPSNISRDNLEYAWRYQDQEGQPVMIACRYKCPKKGKRFVPYHLNEAGAWQIGAGSQPYSLYGLNLLKYYTPSSMVFISEGEKAATAVQHLDLLGVTSSFGADSCSKTDWSPLKVYNQFIIFPDQDDPGEKYAQEVGELLLSINSEAQIWICHLPGLPKG
jgi:putative DNA primase/helicase